MNEWSVNRPIDKPYTSAGVKRKPCIRDCGRTGVFQWQICSDGNRWRVICAECDIELNRKVLEFMRHPDVNGAIIEYTKTVNERMK